MSVAKKLQVKPGQSTLVLNQPDEVVLDLPDQPGDDETADAVVLFVRVAADLTGADADTVLAAARRDSLAWVAYPKGGQLGTDLNRDTLAAALAERGVRAVRQVSIDDTWSALRFRPEH